MLLRNKLKKADAASLEMKSFYQKKDLRYSQLLTNFENKEREVVLLSADIKEKESQLLKLTEEINTLKLSADTKNESQLLKLTEEINALKDCKILLDYYEMLHRKRSESLDRIFSSNLSAFPYLAGIIADYKTWELDIMIKELSWGDNVARKKKVASLVQIKKETKRAIEEAKTAQYQLEYLKTLFPTLEDIIETDFRSLDLNINLADYDPIRNYLKREEYQKLSESERNQLALDRYIQSRSKNNWQIGRDYELYVGYKYSLSGYSIDYFGSYMGLEDLGRDLIAKKNDTVLIIQCKYWSSSKTIHEKHVAQLYGTYICYCLDKNISPDTVKPVLVTSTSLSDMAKSFCQYLGVSYKENYKMGDFPRIKCNIGKDSDGNKTKIYHLPMDQQYDNVKIDKPDECWAFTVEEAEALGFRRAYKWHAE